tara:strand:- start:1 stop:171 length:171 start_codon:yes stop_codon:yes gene_type:complete
MGGVYVPPPPDQWSDCDVKTALSPSMKVLCDVENRCEMAIKLDGCMGRGVIQPRHG